MSSSTKLGRRPTNANEVIPIRSHIRSILAGLCALVAILAIASPASAQNCVAGSPTQDQYGEQTQQGQVCAQQGSGATATSEPSNVGSLPFTGLDLGLMGAAALAVVGGGVLVHRRSRAEEGA